MAYKKKLNRTKKIILKKAKKAYKISSKNCRKLLKKKGAKKLIIGATALSVITISLGGSYVDKKKRDEAMNKVLQAQELLQQVQANAKEQETVVAEAALEKTTTFTKPEGCTVSPHVENIHARPKSVTYEVLQANSVTVEATPNGEDHAPIDQATKFKILDQIESKFGRSAYRLFNPMDITQVSGLTAEQFEMLLPPDLKDIAQSLYDFEHPKDGKKPINGLFLLGKTRLESAHGTSRLAKEKNNLAGIGANDGTPEEKAQKEAFFKTKPGDKADPNWAPYGKEFKSKEECMKYLRDILIKNYLDPKGPYYQGDDKGVVSIFDINKYYSIATGTWAYKIMDQVEKAEEQLGFDY